MRDYGASHVGRSGAVSIAFRCLSVFAASTALSVAIAPATISRAEAGAAVPISQPRDFVVPLVAPGGSRAAAATGPTIPLWTGSITASQNGKKYRYQMVGQDPARS